MIRIFPVLLLIFLISGCVNTEDVVLTDTEVLEKSLSSMREIYSELSTETCGEIAQRLLVELRNQGIKARTIIWFVDPSQRYESHVANEMWLPNTGEWVYLDPTFNGYYRDSSTKRMLDASTIREYASDQIYTELEFVQNEVVKEKYDIRKYYINPLRLTRGLIYRYDQEYYQLVDSRASIVDITNSSYKDFKVINPIDSPDDIEKGIIVDKVLNKPVRWGLPSFGDVLSLSWEKKNNTLVGSANIIDPGFFMFKMPMPNGNATVEVTGNSVNINDNVRLDTDYYYNSKIFYAGPGILNIEVVTERAIIDAASLTKIENRFKENVVFIHEP